MLGMFPIYAGRENIPFFPKEGALWVWMENLRPKMGTSSSIFPYFLLFPPSVLLYEGAARAVCAACAYQVFMALDSLLYLEHLNIQVNM